MEQVVFGRSNDRITNRSVNNLVDFGSEDNNGLSASHKRHFNPSLVSTENLCRNVGLGSPFLSDIRIWLRFYGKTHLFSSAVAD